MVYKTGLNIVHFQTFREDRMRFNLLHYVHEMIYYSQKLSVSTNEWVKSVSQLVWNANV